MKAMILSAGLGTRLKPLTNNCPKALVEVAGKPLIVHAIEKLRSHGFVDIVVNVHHFADQMISFLGNYSLPGVSIQISDESALLLDTGGAVYYARDYFNDHFLVYNVDVITSLDLKLFYQTHIETKALATLAVSDRSSKRKLLFDSQNQLKGRLIENEETKHLRAFAFSGVHVISPHIFGIAKKRGAFSIIDLYLELCSTQKILAYNHSGTYWLDAGKPEALVKAQEYLNMAKSQ